MLTITSAQNPQIKQLQKLQTSRRQRQETGLFVAEGVKLTEEAMAHGLAMHVFYYTLRAQEKYPDAIRQLSQYAAETVLLSDELGERIGQSTAPQGVYALCAMLDNGADLAKIKKNGRYLLANGLQDPGNIGTIIRSCGAFGVDGLILSEDCPDIYSPKVLRAAMGGVFHLPILRTEDMPGLIRSLQGDGMRIYAAALTEDAQPIETLNLGDGCGVLIGNEGNGLPAELAELCDCRGIIPIAPGTESLNAAIAASIFLYEMSRGRL